MNLIGDAPFRIGDWRIDAAVDEISRDGTTVKLEPRAMRILVCLAISIPRRTLGDDPKDPRFQVLERKLKFPD